MVVEPTAYAVEAEDPAAGGEFPLPATVANVEAGNEAFA